MTEIFYDISHLTTNQLRELFAKYSKLGWIDFEFIELSDEFRPMIDLSEQNILLNIQSGNENNYFVFMLGVEDEEDGIMIGFGLTYYEQYAAYLHLAPKYLKEIVSHYDLPEIETPKAIITIRQYLIEQSKKQSLN